MLTYHSFQKKRVRRSGKWFSYGLSSLSGVLLLSIFFFTPMMSADSPPDNAPGIHERLGETAKLDYLFAKTDGDSVRLKTLVDRPTIVSFVYFRCPGICTPLLSGLIETLDLVNAKPGEDFRVLTISINKDEDADLAQKKKKNFMRRLKREFPSGDWWWLTGDSTNIQGITRELGFGFKRTGNDFAHGAAIMVLSKSGKIARYLHGTTFNPFDLKMALIEAAEERSGPSIAKVIKFCFSYDPEGRKYVLNVTRIAGFFILTFAAVVFLIVSIKSKKKSKRK